MALRVVKLAETARHDALIDLDRVALLRNDLSGRLQAAVERERIEAEEAVIAAARAECARSKTALQDHLPAYERAGIVIAETCRLEQAHQRALERLRRAVQATLPIGATSSPSLAEEGLHLHLADRVVLPASRRGAGFIWRHEPPPVSVGFLQYRHEAEIYGRN